MKFDKKKEKILEAGYKCFGQYGYYKTTMEDIAGMVGMKKNSLYYYFENKDALFRELIELESMAHYNRLREIIDKDIKLSVKDRIIKIVEDEIDFLRERTLKYSIRLDKFIEIHQIIRKTFPEIYDKKREIFEEILYIGIENGEFKSSDINLLAKDMVDITLALFNHHCIDSEAEFVHEIDFNLIVDSAKRVIGYILNSVKL